MSEPWVGWSEPTTLDELVQRWRPGHPPLSSRSCWFMSCSVCHGALGPVDSIRVRPAPALEPELISGPIAHVRCVPMQSDGVTTQEATQ